MEDGGHKGLEIVWLQLQYHRVDVLGREDEERHSMCVQRPCLSLRLRPTLRRADTDITLLVFPRPIALPRKVRYMESTPKTSLSM